MASYTYKPNRAGMREMMRSREMQALMIEHAKDVADDANQMADSGIDAYGEVPYYAVGPQGEPVTGIVSAHAFVRTGNLSAMIDQAYHDTLNKAL